MADSRLIIPGLAASRRRGGKATGATSPTRRPSRAPRALTAPPDANTVGR